MIATVLARLRAQLPCQVYDGLVPDRPALPYVVWWSSAPQRSADRHVRRQNRQAWEGQSTSVGARPEQVLAVQRLVQGALVDLPVADGQDAPTRLRHVGAQPVRPDRDVDPPVFLGVDQWAAYPQEAA